MAKSNFPEWNEPAQIVSQNQLPFNPTPEKDINLLILGETGVGKTTFINAFANYLVYDTLDAAIQGDIQILIPAVFSVTSSDTHQSTPISVGSPDKNELCEENGKSQTQGCKSYLFSIGNRYLRLIDTPGIGDCRGVEQDNINFDHILAFVSRYEHLNGICILLKPNENRLNILFKYGVKELLKHLHVNAKDNIMFVFTNSRINFYMPGATANQLRILLKDLEKNTQTPVPFDKSNTFLFDNEAFRYLAVRKAGHDFFRDQKSIFIDSWNKSVVELHRMLARIMKCDLHAVRDMQSLNEAQQLIRKLMRPIGEVARLLEENIQLANQHKNNVLTNAKDVRPNRMPQKTAKVVALEYPRTICTSSTCSKVTRVNGEVKIDYKIPCHEHCYLQGVEQEVINNSILKHCRAMDKTTGICRRCNCDWSKHMHVTYEFQKQLSFIDVEERQSVRFSERMTSRIDQRITELKKEQEIIGHICAKLSVFLKVNSLSAINDDIVEYINHFIREEKQKQSAGDENEQTILGLEKMIEDYRTEVQLLRSNADENTNVNDLPTVDDIFMFKYQLFQLPITGKYIEDQVHSLNVHQMNLIEQREKLVQLPNIAQFSTNMRQLEQLIS